MCLFLAEAARGKTDRPSDFDVASTQIDQALLIIRENPDSLPATRTHDAAMLLIPGSDLNDEQNESGLVESTQRAEELLTDVRDLLRDLRKKKAPMPLVATRLARLTQELRATCNSIRYASEDTAAGRDDRDVRAQVSSLLLTQCPAGSCSEPRPDQVALAKETLAKIAAQLAGRSPDEKVTVKLAGKIAFDDQVWRYPDFIDRAERAFAELAP